MKHKTSWTTEQLHQLSQRFNHKIVKDNAGEFRWYNNINGTWQIHSIQVYENYSKPASFLEYWLVKWNEEYTDRIAMEYRQRRRRYKRLKRKVKITQTELIAELKQLYPEWTNQEIANDLNISLRTVQRYLDK